MPALTLRPFTYAELATVEPWFHDADTQRWLGGPAWPRQMLELADRPLGEFRGARETGRYRWVGWNGNDVVGYIDCATYDRWTTWEGGADGRGVIAAMDVPSAGMSYVVDPDRRGQGICPTMIVDMMGLPTLSHIKLFGAGVEPANSRSIRCLRSVGFRVLDPEPDWEGFVYYVNSTTFDGRL